MRRIAVIGTGPAGGMAALTASASPGVAVDTWDAGVPLATLLRTGGGRCNVTNAEQDGRAFAACYPRGGHFLISLLSRFGSSDTMEWFASRGLPLTVEEEGRVFPRSGRAESVRDVLSGEARRLGVTMRARAPVATVRRVPPRGFELPGVRDPYDRLVIATGGDWKDGGSAGYALARSLGHTVTPLAPSLAALVTAEAWPARIAGLTLPSARLLAFDGKRRIADERGSLLFTHTGISGPLAFRISSRCAFFPFSREAPLRLVLKVLPDLGRGSIDAAIIAAARDRPRLQAASALRALVPRSLASELPGLAGVEPSTPLGQLSRASRTALVSLLDQLPLNATGTRPGAEMVTAGGISLDEVDPRTMESRIVPGLYFCGEVLDIDGYTGGYNLQAAWSTGHCAGLAVAG